MRGYARITLTEIAKYAGLSQALVNFHFETKDQLLADTLEFLAEEYRANWSGALERAAPDPASQLDAMVRADFHPALCTPSILSAWCAFWGETQSRPLFQQICGAKNEHYNHTLGSDLPGADVRGRLWRTCRADCAFDSNRDRRDMVRPDHAQCAL